MIPLRSAIGCLAIFLLAAWRAESQPIYYNASSATLAQNTLSSVATNGTGNTNILIAKGVDFNKINRCTAVAVDALNSKLFFIDGSANAIWSVGLDGSNLTRIATSLTPFPTDLALDVLNEKIYYTTSSTIQTNNTVQRMDYTGSNNVTLFTATGNSRCTALAVDLLNSKLFVADGGAQKIWGMSLTGANPTVLTTISGAYPTDVALDAANQLVYFTASSTVQSSNLIGQMNYSGAEKYNRYTASGGVQRCTALDLDLQNGIIYLSDAGANTLWRMPQVANGTSPTAVLSGLPATAKKVRWYNGLAARPAPGLVGIRLLGPNLVFDATNGYAGGTYYVLTSSNLNSPPSQWLPIQTNVLATTGNFSLTASNALAATLPRQFYLLRVQ